MKDILVVCPTRERHDLRQRMYDSWKTCTEERSDLLFVADADDSTPHVGETMVVQRGNLVEKMNAAVADRIDCGYRFMFFLGDDNVFCQPWESEVLSAAPEFPLSLQWTYDGFQVQHLPVHPMLSTKLCKLLGWFFYPKLKHYFVDNASLDFARYLGYELGVGDAAWRFHRNVLIEHRHVDTGKGKDDAVYAASRQRWNEDSWTYNNVWLRHELWQTVRRVCEAYKQEQRPAEEQPAVENLHPAVV